MFGGASLAYALASLAGGFAGAAAFLAPHNAWNRFCAGWGFGLRGATMIVGAEAKVEVASLSDEPATVFPPRVPPISPTEVLPSPPDVLEYMIDFQVTEFMVFGKDFFEQRPEPGDVPLAVAEFVDEPILGVFRVNGESLIK